tara:strand:+ start:149 stop:460 length:312 start_codon:yes stop_codon:yes gene_type:complete
MEDYYDNDTIDWASFDNRIDDDILVCGAWNNSIHRLVVKVDRWGKYLVCGEWKHDLDIEETMGQYFDKYDDAFLYFKNKIKNYNNNQYKVTVTSDMIQYIERR